MGGLTLFASPHTDFDTSKKIRRMQHATPHLGQAQTQSAGFISLGVQQRHREADIYQDERFIVAINGYLSSLAESDDETHTLDAKHLTRLLHESGHALLPHLTGEFVLAFVDKHKHETYIATSAVLTRPLFWMHSAEGCALASECRQLWIQNNSQPRIRKEAVIDLMAFHGPTKDFELTLFENIYRLSPATLYRITPKNPKPEIVIRLWEPPAEGPSHDENQLLELTEHRIKNANTRAMRNTQSAFSLSGGLDSTLLWAMAQKTPETRHNLCGAHSMLYPGMPCDETQRIETVLQHTQTQAVGQDGRALSESLCLPFQLTAVDQVLTRATAYQVDTLSLSMRQAGANTHITGAGAELIFHASPRFSNDLWRKGQFASAINITWSFEDYGIHYGQGFKRVLKDTLLPAGSSWRKRLKPITPPAYLPQAWQTYWAHGAEDEYSNSLQHGYGRGERLTYWQRYVTASSLESSLQLSEQYGIDFRSPYFDRPLLDLAFSTPPQQLTLNNRQKGLLRRVAQQWLPASITEQNQKTRHDSATSGDMALLSQHRSPTSWQLVANGLLNPDFLSTLLDQAIRTQQIPPKLEYLLLIERFAGRYTYS